MERKMQDEYTIGCTLENQGDWCAWRQALGNGLSEARNCEVSTPACWETTTMLTCDIFTRRTSRRSENLRSRKSLKLKGLRNEGCISWQLQVVLLVSRTPLGLCSNRICPFINATQESLTPKTFHVYWHKWVGIWHIVVDSPHHLRQQLSSELITTLARLTWHLYSNEAFYNAMEVAFLLCWSVTAMMQISDGVLSNEVALLAPVFIPHAWVGILLECMPLGAVRTDCWR